jgi:hypothetical protein
MIELWSRSWYHTIVESASDERRGTPAGSALGVYCTRVECGLLTRPPKWNHPAPEGDGEGGQIMIERFVSLGLTGWKRQGK